MKVARHDLRTSSGIARHSSECSKAHQQGATIGATSNKVAMVSNKAAKQNNKAKTTTIMLKEKTRKISN
jgi:hypothetical protein